MKKDKKTKETIEMDPYAIDKLHKVPFWLKVLFLKYWFYGALNFYTLIGIYASDTNWQWRAIFTGLIGGAFHDVVINKIILLWETDKHEGQHFTMMLSKKYISFIVNIIYFVVVMVISYILINWLGFIFNEKLKVNFVPGQEPFSFALIILIVDGIFLIIKYIIKRIINLIKSKKNASDN